MGVHNKQPKRNDKIAQEEIENFLKKNPGIWYCIYDLEQIINLSRDPISKGIRKLIKQGRKGSIPILGLKITVGNKNVLLKKIKREDLLSDKSPKFRVLTAICWKDAH